jgi:hypothetical protein
MGTLTAVFLHKNAGKVEISQVKALFLGCSMVEKKKG